MEAILKDIITLISEGMDNIGTVDEDYGQLEALDSEDKDTYPLLFPAVLVDCPQTNWGNTEGLSQKGRCTIGVRLIVDCYDDTHSQSGTVGAIDEREALRSKLHLLLQGHRPLSDGCLMRESSKFYTWNHGIKVYESIYTTTVSEIIQETKKAPKPSIRVSTGLL